VFNNSLPVSSLFYKIFLLSLPHCLLVCIHCPFCSSTFCALCAIPIQCNFCFLYILVVAPPLYFLTHALLHLRNNNLITSLCHVFIASMHLVHVICTILLHLFTVSALSDHNYDFSTSLAVCPCVHHH
jgi:hypothetical protein